MCDQTTNTTGQINGGEVKAYAVTTPERLAEPARRADRGRGRAARASRSASGTASTRRPAPRSAVLAKLAAALKTAAGRPERRRRFAELGTAPASPDQVDARGARPDARPTDRALEAAHRRRRGQGPVAPRGRARAARRPQGHPVRADLRRLRRRLRLRRVGLPARHGLPHGAGLLPAGARAASSASSASRSSSRRASPRRPRASRSAPSPGAASSCSSPRSSSSVRRCAASASPRRSSAPRLLSALASRRTARCTALVIAVGADALCIARLHRRPRAAGPALRPLAPLLSPDGAPRPPRASASRPRSRPVNLLYCFVGVLLGTLVGVLPGIGPTATIAMLLPITFTFEPVTALIMLAGIYYGAQYGGSTTAILINLPGESSSAVTAIDGYQMARKGRAGPALATAALGSFFAGTVATLILAARRAAARPRRAELRRRRVLLADRARPRRLDRARPRLDPQGARHDRARAPARHGRPGHLHRHAALHLRLLRALLRHQLRLRRGRHLRRRRDPAQPRERDDPRRADHAASPTSG